MLWYHDIEMCSEDAMKIRKKRQHMKICQGRSWCDQCGDYVDGRLQIHISEVHDGQWWCGRCDKKGKTIPFSKHICKECVVCGEVVVGCVYLYCLVPTSHFCLLVGAVMIHM